MTAQITHDQNGPVANGDVVVRPVGLSDPVARQLIELLNAELSERYPEEGANHFRLDADEVAPGRGAFLVATDAATGDALGCGALRVLEPGLAEIKRMFVRQAARGRGISRSLLGALEEQARLLGVHRLVLETGVRQHEAVGLYRATGFEPIERFGKYVDAPLSLCMGKTLAGSASGGAAAG